MKKLISLILCMAMVLGLAIGATAAAHNHTISIDARDGYEYEAFQIFVGDLDKTGVLSNITWGSAVKDAAGLLTALKAANATAFGTCNDAEDVAAALGKDSTYDNDVAKAFADIVGAKDDLGNYLYLDASKAYKQPDAATHTITVDHDGYYMIVNTVVPSGTDTTYSRYMLEVVRDVEVAHKGTYPTVDKKIDENGSKVLVNEKSIGDVISYEITGTLPNNLADYDTYYYVFHDTLSKGLTYNNDAKVWVNGKEVTAYFYIGASAYNATTGTEITIGMEDILRLQYVDGVGKLEGGLESTDTTILVKYTATLNENAVIAVAGNPNVVDLEYSNDPNKDGDGNTTPPPPGPDVPTPDYPTGITVEKQVETWTTRLYVRKVDGTGAKLQGAEFKLEGVNMNIVRVFGNHFVLPEGSEIPTWYKLKNNSYTEVAPVYDDPATTDINEDTSYLYETLTPTYVLKLVDMMESKGATPVEVKAMVDSNGYLTFEGLGAGTYKLTETVTPAGFNTIDPIEFTVTFDAEHKEFKSNNSQINVGTDKGNEHYNSLYTTVVNEAGSTLPSTGGIGTTLFYVFGSLMAAGAAVLLVTKRRMAAAE